MHTKGQQVKQLSKRKRDLNSRNYYYDTRYVTNKFSPHSLKTSQQPNISKQRCLPVLRRVSYGAF